MVIDCLTLLLNVNCHLHKALLPWLAQHLLDTSAKIALLRIVGGWEKLYWRL